LGGAMGVVIGALAVGAAPASAVPGLQRVASPVSAHNSVSPKTVFALCPPDQRVIGGGGSIIEGADVGLTAKPALTQLEPVFAATDAYVVTAAETRQGTTGNWRVAGWAMCANPLPGLHLASVTTGRSTSPAQATAAVCPGGQRVLGTGGNIRISSPGRVALQVARPSEPGDIARVRAHEDADGFAGLWSVTAYAVCAPEPAGYDVMFGAPSMASGSETIKTASATCPPGTRVHSAGAATTAVAPAQVGLQRIVPSFVGTTARAVETAPTGADWDFILATAICAF